MRRKAICEWPLWDVCKKLYLNNLKIDCFKVILNSKFLFFKNSKIFFFKWNRKNK